MEQQNTGPITVKKRKLPSFMAAPVRTQQSSHNDAQEQDLPVQSPKIKQNGQGAAAKKQRQSQLPVQRRKRVAKSARAQDQPSQKQQTVLTISDAALVKQCKDILSRSATGTGAAQAEQAELQPSDTEQHKHALLPFQPQPVCLDIMDPETQLLEVSPRATLKYEAAHQPELAHRPADHTHSLKDMGFILPAKESAPVDSADMHDSQAQPDARGELPTSPMAPESAADSQSTRASANNNNVKQPPVSTLTTVVPQDPLTPAAPASTQGASGINALLEAMLTGELA